MSSLSRILASQANGARSKGPLTAEGKRRSSQNAISHGLLAKHIVMRDESPEGFEAVMTDHLTRLQPADGVELGMIEEMVASYWHLRRAWAIETRLLENETDAQTSGDSLDRMTKAFSDLAATPSLGLMHRYQTRLHLNYQRALYNMLLLRAATVPNEPSPISEHRGTDDRLLSSVNLSPVNERVICLPAPDEPEPDPET
jgi:hypothetical protein